MNSVSQEKLFTGLGQAHEFELAMQKLGVKGENIQGVIDGLFNISFMPIIKPKSFNFKQFLSWLRKNNLDSKLSGGLLDQIVEQEKFYQKYCRDTFYIDRNKIRIDVRRLPAIKAGLEAGCLNYALIKVTPKILSEVEAKMTGAEFFFERLAKSLKKDGFKIWAETGTD
jgi:hypothetical protein